MVPVPGLSSPCSTSLTQGFGNGSCHYLAWMIQENKSNHHVLNSQCCNDVSGIEYGHSMDTTRTDPKRLGPYCIQKNYELINLFCFSLLHPINNTEPHALDTITRQRKGTANFCGLTHTVVATVGSMVRHSPREFCVNVESVSQLRCPCRHVRHCFS